MIDNIIRTNRGQRQPGEYRADSLSLPRSKPRMAAPLATSVVSVPASAPVTVAPTPAALPVVPVAIAQPVATATAEPEFIPPAPAAPILSPSPAIPKPLPTIKDTSKTGSGYVSNEVDEVFTKIAALESEKPFTPSLGTVHAETSAATLIQNPVVRIPSIPRKHPAKRWRLSDRLWYGGSVVLVIGILSVTGYISVDTWLTNQQVKQVVAEKQEAAAAQSVVLGEGEDETPILANAIGSYTVAPDLPKLLKIDKMSVNARILPMSVTASGAMQAPVNIYDSGWYSASAKPGQPGAAVIDAHASGATRQGLFAYLDTLATGDTLSVERGDGTTFTYKVTHTETVALNEVDMKKLLKPYGAATEGVNLITCTGTWLPDQKTYDHRVIVYTERV